MNNDDKNNNLILLVGAIIILLIVVSVFAKPRKHTVNKSVSENKTKIFDDFSYIIPKELRTKITSDEPLTLLDIRDAVSFRKAHLKNSVNIPYNNYSEKNINKLSKDKLIVVIGYDYNHKKELGDVIKTLKDSGFKNIVALSGGIRAWIEDNNPVINEGNPKSVVDAAKIEYILPEQLKLAIDNNYPVFILDVRPKLLYEQGHIKNAVNIPLNQLENRKTELPIDKEIVAYGKDKMEDFKTGVKLYDLGFMATYLIKGGLYEWKQKGFEMAK